MLKNHEKHIEVVLVFLKEYYNYFDKEGQNEVS